MHIDPERLLDALPGLVWVTGPDGAVLFSNARWRSYVGAGLDPPADHDWKTLVHPEDACRTSPGLSHPLTTDDPDELELRLRRSDASYQRFRITSSPWESPCGQPRAICHLGIEVRTGTSAPDRSSKATGTHELALQRAMVHLTQAQQLSHTGSFTTDVDADEHVWSDELYRILDFEPGTKVKFQTFRALIHRDDLARFDAGFRLAVTEGAEFDHVFRITTLRGTLKHLHAISNFTRSDDGRRVVVGSIQDVTASRVAEEALSSREAELRRALTQLAEGQHLSATGSFTSDIQRDQHSWSLEFYRIFQIDPGAQPSVQAIRNRIHPDDLELFDQEIRHGIDGGNADFNFRIVTPEKGLRHLHGVARVMEYVDGRPIFMGTVQDISDRKAAQEALDKARRELAHISRVASLSALTASIAHEVNQPLTSVVLSATTCVRTLAADPADIPRATASAQRAIRDAQRASEVIRRLRAMFSGRPPVADPVELNEAAREVLTLTSSVLRADGVVLQTDLTEQLPTVDGDRVQLQQVILNLILNAADAMRAIKRKMHLLQVSTGADEDGHIVLAVSDTGVGASPELLEQMFNSFYTTKSDGMGVGLSVSRSIVEAHGGRLMARINEGPGLTFSLRLPVPIRSGIAT